MTTADYALLTSLLALVVSIFALLWNVWQKFIFVKPTLQVSFGVYNQLKMKPGGESAGPSGRSLLVLTVTNMGPGPVILYACIAKQRSHWWARAKAGYINPIHNHPLDKTPVSIGPFSAGLPAKIDAGEIKTFYFPYTKECFLHDGIVRAGVTDTFGRTTWCSLRNMRTVNKSYVEDFGLSA